MEVNMSGMDNICEKVEHAKKLIKKEVKKHAPAGVACSFGKDSMVVTHLARQVYPKIPVFSVMTIHKFKETFEYLVRIDREMKLDVKVYMVADSDDVPRIFRENDIDVVLMSTKKYKDECMTYKTKTRVLCKAKDKQETCCNLLKVEPIKEAVKDLNCWIAGLRKGEGETRRNYKEVEYRGSIVKVNPILNWTETDVWKYLAIYQIPLHPLYAQGYRSLGCKPCTEKVKDSEPERAGRWKGTSNCGGECGIHTQIVK